MAATATAPARETRLSPAVVGVVACLGASAVIAQIVLMRELMVVFSGNEMSLGVMLAAWLFWTAIGAAVPGARGARVREPRRLVATLQAGIALVFPLTVVGMRASRTVFHPTLGEMLGPGAMLATSVVALAPFCLLSGWLFAATSQMCRREPGATVAGASGTVYLLDAMGSALGGLVASAALLPYAGDFQIAVLVGAVNLLSAAAVGPRTRQVRAAIIAIAAVFAVTLSLLGPRIEAASLARLWPGLQLVATRNSIYGNLSVLEAEGNRTLYENGAPAFHAGDRPAAEEAVHLALLQHPAPRSLLLIGGIGNGSLAQALQHRGLTRIDAVELDPAVISLARRYFPQAALDDPRVHIHNVDGRLFVKTTAALYDVIALNLPEPQTAQWNRFYTREFFAEAARRLNPGGVLSFGVRGAEDYTSPELAEFLACLRGTLREVFPEVAVTPGSTVHFSAARQRGVLPATTDELLARLRARQVDTLYVSEYFLPYRLSAERLRGLEQDMARAPVRVNRDFTPAAYYFGVTLWSARYGAAVRDAFLWLAKVRFAVVLAVSVGVMLLIAAIVQSKRGPNPIRKSAAFCAGAMGLTAMALEILLLLGFQAIYGYVYAQLAIIVAAFMAGLALGSRWGLARSPASPGRRLVLLQALAAAAPLLMYASLLALRQWSAVVAFPILAIAGGVLAGYQFQMASRVYFGGGAGEAGAGALYAVDLIGGCVAALAVSTYLIPVHGMLKTAVLVAAVNVVAAAAVFLTSYFPQTRAR